MSIAVPSSDPVNYACAHGRVEPHWPEIGRCVDCGKLVRFEMIETNCPECNVRQRFARQTREVEDGFIEVFLSCSCGFEMVAYRSTYKIEATRRDMKALTKKIAAGNRHLESLLDRRGESLRRQVVEAGLAGEVPLG